MSFGTYERKVRDPSLAYGQRINALVGCVERYSPVGFHVTFGYLEEVAGQFRRDEEALLRAMDALSSSRGLWLIELDAFASERKAAKRLGRRSPSAREANRQSAVWFGDAKNASMFALAAVLGAEGRDRLGPARTVDAAVLSLAATCLDQGGHLDDAAIHQVRVLRSQFVRLRRVSGWPDIDWPTWHRAHDSLWALHLIGIVCALEPTGH